MSPTTAAGTHDTSIEDRQEDLQTVADSVSSMSNNVEYVSQRQHYFVYENKRDIDLAIDDARTIVEERPGHLLGAEIRFLEEFIEVFRSGKHHQGYNIENRAYLRLFESALKALDTRFEEERAVVMDELETDTAYTLQDIFYRLKVLLEQEEEHVETHWKDLIRGRKSAESGISRVNELIKDVVRAYTLEEAFMNGDDPGQQRLDNLADRVNQRWLRFRDLDTPFEVDA